MKNCSSCIKNYTKQPYLFKMNKKRSYLKSLKVVLAIKKEWHKKDHEFRAEKLKEDAEQIHKLIEAIKKLEKELAN